MFRKLFSVLVILLMFIAASCNVPAYAEDEGVFTLEPCKLYLFNKTGSVKAEFSKNVLCGGVISSTPYDNVLYYHYWSTINVGSTGKLFVYNCNDESVTMDVIEGTINGFEVVDYPISIVMYDASEMDFKMINNTDSRIRYKRFNYNEVADRLDDKSGTDWLYDSATLTGRGALLFLVDINDLEDNITFEGEYEVSDYVRKGFFQGPPWILKMDLAGMIRALLDQLSMLLPVGLVILSAFLLISLMRYIVRSFL